MSIDKQTWRLVLGDGAVVPVSTTMSESLVDHKDHWTAICHFGVGQCAFETSCYGEDAAVGAAAAVVMMFARVREIVPPGQPTLAEQLEAHARVIRAYAAHLHASEASLGGWAKYEESCGSGAMCGGEPEDVISELRVVLHDADRACNATKAELDIALVALKDYK